MRKEAVSKSQAEQPMSDNCKTSKCNCTTRRTTCRVSDLFCSTLYYIYRWKIVPPLKHRISREELARIQRSETKQMTYKKYKMSQIWLFFFQRGRLKENFLRTKVSSRLMKGKGSTFLLYSSETIHIKHWREDNTAF